MTAGERLVHLSGLGAQSAGAHLVAVAQRWAGVMSGSAEQLLVAYSGLPSATAAEHLLHNRASAARRDDYRPRARAAFGLRLHGDANNVMQAIGGRRRTR